jgi:MFS family permease
VLDPELAAASAPVSAAYRRFALWLLLLVYVVNFLDRQVINILAEPIKNDLHLADWQVGLLSGFAFGIVYTLLGFPLARAADRHNRPVIIAACLAAWSGFTGVCGLAQNFVQLAAARAGVGIGEAGCTPTSHALIADYTPPEKRASALAFYSMGTPIGSLLGLVVGGAMADYFGWRKAFLVAAVPGLALAVICLFTLKEPRALIAAQSRRVAAASATFAQTFAHLRGKKAFWYLAFGAGVRAFLGYGHAPFSASFFYRVHGHDVAALAAAFGLKPQTFIGLALGTIGGIAGTFGAWLGGRIADYASTRDVRWFGAMSAVSVVVSTPIGVWGLLTPSTPLALALGVIPAVLGSLWYGPVYSSAQGMVPPHMRATAASMMLFVINFMGLVLGAVCIGALSDWLNHGFHMGPAEGVRWAMVLSSIAGLVSVWLFWAARRDIRQNMES